MGNKPEYVVQFSITCTLCRQPAGLCKLIQLQSHSFPMPLCPGKKKKKKNWIIIRGQKPALSWTKGQILSFRDILAWHLYIF